MRLRQHPQQQLKVPFGHLAQQAREGVARSTRNIPGLATMAASSLSAMMMMMMNSYTDAGVAHAELL